MGNSDCNRLDDFLDNDLSSEERSRFIGHLDACAACRESVNAHRTLARSLKLAIERQPFASPELANRIESRIRKARIRRFAVTALAASVAFAALWLAIDRPPRTLYSPPPVVVLDRPASEPTVRIRFPNRDVIAMPIASDSPNVTVVMVYPELQAAAPAPLERNER